MALACKHLHLFQFKSLFNRSQGACVFSLFSLNPEDLRVRHNAVMRGVMGSIHYVLSFTLHPSFDQETLDYDVALLQVSKTTLSVMTFM